MQNIGRELHRATGAFNVTRLDRSPPHILDMCMAPGGFLFAALQRNPDAVATACTFPFGGSTNGHWVFLPDHSNIKKMYLDITMLAADMGVEGIPQDACPCGPFLQLPAFVIMQACAIAKAWPSLRCEKNRHTTRYTDNLDCR